MSLATRCASCNTVFRVVQDQLKISEGWVRCGRCDAVFNALEGLFDLGREVPAEQGGADDAPTPELGDAAAPSEPWVAPLPAAVANAPPAGDASAADPPPLADEAIASPLEDPFADPVDAHLFGPRKRADSAPKPAGQLGERDRLEFSDARFDSDLFAENAPAADGDGPDTPPTDAADLPLESATLRPDFMRRAERRARWSAGPARAALGAGVLALVIALALQLAHHARDDIAAQYPALRPTLAAWCAAAACTIEPLRRIDDVLVESTALTRVPDGDGFLLSVNLRNRGTLALKLPSIDLHLTDANGRLVARRALAAKDFRVPDVLPAGAETALQLNLATSTVVAGYTVEIFYP